VWNEDRPELVSRTAEVLHMQRATRVPFFLLLAVAFCPCTGGQQPIRVDVNLVNVAFTARDSNGALIGNLRKEDVELYEDTVPQKIEFFAKSIDLPLTLALIMDVSGSQEHFAKKHQKDLEVFLREVLGINDRVFLICFGNHLRLVSDYTNSPDLLLAAFQEFEKGKTHFPEIGPREDRDLGTAFYDSIYYSVTEKLTQPGRRKAILMFSDGEDNSSSHNMMEAIEAAQAANVPVYCIRYTESKHGDLNARNKYGISVMERVAHETGGAHIDAGKTDPHTYFRQIGEELRASYELAYYPTNRGKDNSFRKIVVKPKQDGIRIRAKTGYFAD
jgi:Ca-activated chloride channel homolog